ncbi:hypothetical protein PENTCL1PPCAC_5904, partial [Pristionchus entomophagus]
MGAIISIFEKGFAGLTKGFVKGIGEIFKGSLTDPAKKIGDGISGITDGAGAEFEAYRKDFSKWFELPDRLSPNVNSLTSVVVHLSEPVYALIIIPCTLASIVMLSYLFKKKEEEKDDDVEKKSMKSEEMSEINISSGSKKVDKMVEKYELKMLE